MMFGTVSLTFFALLLLPGPIKLLLVAGVTGLG